LNWKKSKCKELAMSKYNNTKGRFRCSKFCGDE
jgi:hypothetical protein